MTRDEDVSAGVNSKVQRQTKKVEAEWERESGGEMQAEGSLRVLEREKRNWGREIAFYFLFLFRLKYFVIKYKIKKFIKII